jgi:hypothetical protein
MISQINILDIVPLLILLTPNLFENFFLILFSWKWWGGIPEVEEILFFCRKKNGNKLKFLV